MVSRKSTQKLEEYQKAFQEDCEMLLRRFVLQSTYSYDYFAEIWTELKFSFVYLGKYNDYEIGHFTHMVLHSAKKYFLLSNCKFTQTGGLYLLYGLYFKQPIKDLIKIRFLSEEVHIIQEYLSFPKQENAAEPVTIFNILLTANAFEFVAAQHQLPADNRYHNIGTDLQNDIFPETGNQIVNEFMQETNTTLKKLSSLEAKILTKLEAYKTKHPDVFIDYNNVINDEMIQALSSNEYLLKSDNDCGEEMETQASCSSKKDNASEEELKETRRISEAKKSIINKAFKMDTRSKLLKQLAGEEKLRKNV